ncbi:thioredoxin [Thermoplasmatales archaeon BRNA1]|nr:thioredoxin [Thermoplasmatales archaeon BRNA1]
MAVTELNSATFKDFVKNNKVAMVDCWAPWCGPCRRMGPEVDKVAEALAGKVAVGKLNTDDNQDVAAEFGINAIPTLLIFKDGVQQDPLVGLRPADDVISYLEQYIE